MWGRDFLNKFIDWLDIPDANDVDEGYEPPPLDECGLKPEAPDSAIEAYEKFKKLYREAEERGERV
jgi:hypothetical protein